MELKSFLSEELFLQMEGCIISLPKKDTITLDDVAQALAERYFLRYDDADKPYVFTYSEVQSTRKGRNQEINHYITLADPEDIIQRARDIERVYGSVHSYSSGDTDNGTVEIGIKTKEKFNGKQYTTYTFKIFGLNEDEVERVIERCKDRGFF